MAGPAIQQARNGATTFLQQLPTGDQTAVISFGSQVNVLKPMSPDRNAAIAVVGGLQASGNTALYGAVAQSISVAQEVQLPGKAIVLLSDGVEMAPEGAAAASE